jgi:GTP-binding protein EngB required for normal cell division
MYDLKQAMSIVQQSLTQKSNIQDVCALIDLKANADETDNAIANLQTQM